MVHQARRNNNADVAAKDGSQETAVNLVGLLLSLVITPIVSTSHVMTFSLFVFLVASHLFCNYQAVRALRYEALNRQRLQILFRQFLQCGWRETGESNADASVSTPEDVARHHEQMLWWETIHERDMRVHAGVSLSRLIRALDHGSADALQALAAEHRRLANEKYLCCVESPASSLLLAFADGAGPMDYLRAYIHTQMYKHLVLLGSGSGNCKPKWMQAILNSHVGEQDEDHHPPQHQSDLIRQAHTLICHPSVGDRFVEALRAAGWNLERVLIAPGEWRFQWTDEFLKRD